jgi:hypothetical protein
MAKKADQIPTDVALERVYGIPDEIARRFLGWFEYHNTSDDDIDADIDGITKKFLGEAARITRNLATWEESRAKHHPPNEARAELKRVADILGKLSHEARYWLCRGPAPGPQRDLLAASNAQRAMLAHTGNTDLVAELIERARHALPRRAANTARLWLAMEVRDLLERFEIPVSAAPQGAYVGLLTIIIEAVDLPYDPREIARTPERVGLG